MDSTLGTYQLNSSITCIVATGIEPIESNNVRLFPNPVDQTLTIESLNSAEIKNIKLYDISGRTALQSHIVNDKIELSDIERGIYFIEVQTNFYSIKRKIIKE